MAALLRIVLSLVILTAFEPAAAFDDAMATSNIAGLGSLSHVVAEARAAENADWIVALRREIHMVLPLMDAFNRRCLEWLPPRRPEARVPLILSSNN